MDLEIRLARPSDLDRLMAVFEKARAFMQATGNARQWINGYPQRGLLAEEIAQKHCHVCLDTQGKIVGTFCFIPSPDPNYIRIEGGNWLDDEPYHVIHRVASDGSCRGVFGSCIRWCEERCANLRVDTHEDNKIMQALLLKHGFVRCGIIYVANGTPRIAFQKHVGRTEGI